MIWFLRIAAMIVLVSMLCVTTWASSFVALWKMPRELDLMPFDAKLHRLASIAAVVPAASTTSPAAVFPTYRRVCYREQDVVEQRTCGWSHASTEDQK